MNETRDSEVLVVVLHSKWIIRFFFLNESCEGILMHKSLNSNLLENRELKLS
jgi:hypothetical protein